MIHDWLAHPITRSDLLQMVASYLLMQMTLVWRDRRRARRRHRLTISTPDALSADAMRAAVQRMAGERKITFHFPR